MVIILCSGVNPNLSVWCVCACVRACECACVHAWKGRGGCFLLTVMRDCSNLMCTLMSFQIKASPIEQVIKRLRRRRTSEAVNYLWKHSCAARSSIRGLMRKQIRGEARLYSQRQNSALKQPFNRKSLEHFDINAVIREMQSALPILFDVLLAILQPFSTT